MQAADEYLAEDGLIARLEQQMRFIVEIDKLKRILRRSYLTDGSRRENDAEHSWHLAVMALILREYASDPDIDLFRVLRMVLIHDLVEIDAGDSFLYDNTGAELKTKAEQVAANRIFALLPPDQAAEMRPLWEEFEAGVTAEARFSRALDRLQPLLLIYNARGRTWQEHGVTAEKALALNPPVIADGAPKLAEYARQLLLSAQDKGYFPEEQASTSG